MDLTKLTDKLYTLRQERLAAQKQVDALEAQEKELHAQVFAALDKAPTGMTIGDIAKAEIKESIVPTLVDEKKFLQWANKSDRRRTLLKVGVATDAWRKFASNGGVAEGVEAFTKEDLSLTKVK